MLLKQISESTTIAEKEKQKVLVIVESVSKKAAEIAGVKVCSMGCILGGAYIIGCITDVQVFVP